MARRMAPLLVSETEKKKKEEKKRKSRSLLIVARHVAPFVFALLYVKYSESRFEFFAVF